MQNLTLLCGGRSTEHDITLLSAQNVLASYDKQRYDLTIIYLAPSGSWYRLVTDQAWQQLLAGDADLADQSLFEPIALAFGDAKRPWLSLLDSTVRYPVDVIFPVLHGFEGEDGCVQGLLTMLGVPFVGADCLTSAVCMQKMRTRQILSSAGVTCVPYQAWSAPMNQEESWLAAYNKFGPRVFIKPAQSGSSVGVSAVDDAASLRSALENAARYDEWVMMEPAMTGREIEVAVLGNRSQWLVAGPGEIVCSGDFYSFDAKYVDADTAKTKVPADVSEVEREHILAVARDVACALDCEGMLRVDGFLENGEFVINEVNTIPGFTNISLYPRMFEHAGCDAKQLITQLLDSAFDRFARQSSIERAYALEVSS